MKVYLNEINGLWAAIDAAYFSKRSWTREKEEEILQLYMHNFDRFGMRRRELTEFDPEMMNLMDMLFRWSKSHITLGKFLDFSFTHGLSPVIPHSCATSILGHRGPTFNYLCVRHFALLNFIKE